MVQIRGFLEGFSNKLCVVLCCVVYEAIHYITHEPPNLLRSILQNCEKCVFTHIPLLRAKKVNFVSYANSCNIVLRVVLKSGVSLG
jgi:hypothetical protein